VIEKLFYDVARLLGGCGEVRFQHVFIDGTMLEAQANRHRAVWRKNVDRYEEGRKEKSRGIIRELNRSEGAAFSEDGEGILEQAKGARAYIGMKLEGAEGAGAGLSRKTLKTYRKTLKERVKKLNTYAKQRDIMGKRTSYSKTDNDATLMRIKDETLKAAYNAQLAVEGEYIRGAGIFARRPTTGQPSSRFWNT
jgi:hypothetical protein